MAGIQIGGKKIHLEPLASLPIPEEYVTEDELDAALKDIPGGGPGGSYTLTDEDKAEIVEAVLESLPKAEDNTF